MTNLPLIARELNEVGFPHQGEEVEIVDLEVFTGETETTIETDHGPMPVTEQTQYGRLHLEGGDTVEMKMETLYGMRNHARKHGT